MFHSRKTLDTIRRSSQRRNNQRRARIQRQITLQTIISNLSSCVYQSSATVVRQSSFESSRVIQENNDKDVDNLSLSISSGSINISNIGLNVLESKSSSQMNITTEDQLGENPSSPLPTNSKRIKIVEEIVEDCDSSEDLDEDNHKEKLLIESDDEEPSSDIDDNDIFNNFNNLTDRQFTSKEVALALSLLKSRHSLTNTCITNICKLLKLLRVANCPSNFRHVRSLICNSYETVISGQSFISCPSCNKISSNSYHCTSSSTCPSQEKYVRNPTINHTLHIEPQIRAILERNYLIKPNNNQNKITDIVDAPLYRKILRAEPNPFVTLLMNSDGAVVKSISRSIWITTFVINELSPSIRFNRENLIVGMVSIGSSKPAKEEMQIFLSELVKELIYLEKEGLQYHPIKSPSHIEETVRVFLIAATCDMPASSLMINHTEASGYYGCIHCNIQGENVKIGDGNARIFVYDINNDVDLRSNVSYDETIKLLKQPLRTQRRASINSLNNGLNGLRGPCALRSLKHFDVYQSFACDTLHTLYEGATGRMLQILFGNVSQKTSITPEMSIKKALDTIASTFKSVFYPSSTFRIPRNLKLYSVYKANELKIFLLFGYLAFDGILSPERYDHLRYLAFAAHLIEASNHDELTHLEISDLLQEFNERYENLYTKKQAKPIIHALSHFADSIRQYGPAQNYSTFEFESAVAALTRTIHNGNQPSVELLKNLDLLHQTWLGTTDPSFPPEMQLFDHQITSNVRYSIPNDLSIIHHYHKARLFKKMSINSLPEDVSNFIFKFADDRSYLIFKTIFVNQQRYSADSINIHRTTHDGCVLYDKNDVAAVGFLEAIIHFVDDDEISILIRPVILYSTADTLSINNRLYKCTNILYGTTHGSSIEAIHYKSLIQKLAFRYGTNLNFPPLVQSMFFFQFPNLRSST